MTRCFVAIGSNLDQPLAQVTRAVNALKRHPAMQFIAASPWYQSTAIGPSDQPDYINGVMELRSNSSAFELLAQLQSLENAQGRTRDLHWGARTLDLDLLLFGNDTITTPDLVVPHPRMLERNFVLYPLFDLDPTLTLPDGTHLRDHKLRCASAGLQLVDTNSSNTITPTHAQY